MTKQQKKLTDANHVADIANSIFASWNLFPAERVAFIPFFDNLKNLIQDRIILAFAEVNGQTKLVFHTFEDPYFEKDLNSTIITFISSHSKLGIELYSGLSLYVMKFGFSSSGTDLILDLIALEDVRYVQLNQLIQTIKREYAQLIPSVSSFVANRNGVTQTSEYRQPIVKLIRSDFDLNKDRYLDEIRDLIEECVDDVAHSLLLEAELESKIVLPNLFAVVAYPSVNKRCGLFNYTAQILLTPSQKEAIKLWSNSDDYSAILETPLSTDARSISDTSFCTGFVDYSGIAGRERDRPGGRDDKERQEKEESLYAALTKTSHYEERVVNFIPIFLNGCPWIVFYTLSKKGDDSNAWDHNYFIYRDLISKVGNSIRIKAKNKYFEIIGNIIESSYQGVSEASGYIDKVNRQLEQLSCFFPFAAPLLQLKPKNGASDAFFLNRVEFRISPRLLNPFWNSYLEYDNISADVIFKRSSELLKSFINQKETENKKRELSIASYSSAHFYGNWLTVMNRAVSNISQDIKKLPENCKISPRYDRLEESRKKIHDANNGMRGVTKIVDLLAKRNTIDDERTTYEFLASDERFSTNDPINLSIIIQKLQALVVVSSDCKLPANLIIDGFLPNGLRPAKEFYENIILEALINYQKRNSGKLTISELVLSGKTKGLIFENPYQCSIGERSMAEPIEVTTEEFTGAILYYHLFLKQYEMGKILYRRTCVDQNGTFELHLYFNHLVHG